MKAFGRKKDPDANCLQVLPSLKFRKLFISEATSSFIIHSEKSGRRLERLAQDTNEDVYIEPTYAERHVLEVWEVGVLSSPPTQLFFYNGPLVKQTQISLTLFEKNKIF